ncbi:MAG: acyl carrier protein [Deltaproteobacteria bacterium]|nr:acyl carrier protein [Candidatus Zymogenaceae bacterium]
MEDKKALAERLKKLIVESLGIEDVTPDDIKDDDPLFGDGLGLDSIDALELVVALEKEFGIVIADEEVGKKIFVSINTLADFVAKERKM